MAFSFDSRLSLGHGRPLKVTSSDNDSVISLSSSDSEREEETEISETRTRHDMAWGEISTDSIATPVRSVPEVRRTSGHQISQTRTRPLKMPEIFRSQTTSATSAFTQSRSRDAPPRQTVQSQRSAPAFQLGSSSVDRQGSVGSVLLESSNTSSAGRERLRPSAGPLLPEEAKPASRPHPSVAGVAPPSELPPLLNLRGQLALPPHIICHSAHAQQRMERLKISWGVQLELARGVLSEDWAWDDVTIESLERLQGLNADAAPKVRSIMLKGLAEDQALVSDVWEEYDREQDAILEGQSRGLGLRGEWKGVPDWYGGKIEQVVKLSKSTSDGTFHYHLGRPALKKSTRFARFLGSRRILKVKPEKNLRYEKDSGIRDRLSGSFVLCGRIFVPFASKDGGVYMMETNEDRDRQLDRGQGDDKRMSYWDFIGWHNPLDLNQNQPLSKWVTRFELGLSTTIPIVQFEPDDISFIPDIEAPQDDGEGSSSDKILTDGCGFINGAALSLIASGLSLSSPPTAVQGRVAGSKGLWILHPEDRSPTEPPRIWIRKSQRKVKHLSLEKGSAHVIFDLVQQSTRITAPARLNYQFIINLAENGVDHEVLRELMREGMAEEFTTLTQWDGPHAMPLLWNAVNKLGNVTRTHLQELALGLARAIGLANRRDMDLLDEDDEEYDEEDTSLYQQVLELIQAGFDPKSSLYLYEKMRYVVRTAIGQYSNNYRIRVKQSAQAFIVPDPLDVLEEGEIHFRSSQELADPLNTTNPYTIQGDVLVGRNPTMVASDIQKVKAIEHEKLADYTNVIVFSTKGSRSLASLLAGGDYDGDTVMLNWAPSVVEKFKQPNVVDKPNGFEKNYFQAHVDLVKDFLQHEHSPSDQVQTLFLSAVLRGLDDDYVGKYSTFHSYAAYTRGYSDPETIRLAYMFTTCLDSKKTGHRVQQAAFKHDSERYGSGKPDCLCDVKQLNESGQSRGPVRRPNDLGPFILDVLQEYGKVLTDAYLSNYERLVGPGSKQDHHLLKPYMEVEARLSEMESLPRVNVKDLIREARQELKMIEDHVNLMKQKWPKAVNTKKKMGSTRNRELDALRRTFASGLDAPHLSLLRVGDVRAIRASYAYKLCHSNIPHFAFSMAFKDLCQIKARASGGTMWCPELAELMEIPKSTVRTLSVLRSRTHV